MSLLLTFTHYGNAHVPLHYNDVIRADQLEVTYQYTFNELEHNSAILCPEGFFIAEMTYKFRNIRNEKWDSPDQRWTTLDLGYVKETLDGGTGNTFYV